MPIGLLKAWAWIRLNAVLLAIVAAVLVAAVGFSYMKGRTHGADACEARYEKRDSAHHKEVIAELIMINNQNAALAKKWDAENAKANSALDAEIVTVYKTLEKVVEVPVPVEGPCNVDYAGTARVFDNAASAAFGH